MAFCPYCGTKADGAFCSSCGQPQPASVNEAPTEAAAPVEPEVPAYEAPACEVPASPAAPETPTEPVAVAEAEAPAYDIPATPTEQAASAASTAPVYEAPAYEAPAAPIGYDPNTGEPIYAEVHAAEPPAPKKNPFAVVGLILSIVALCLCWIPFFIGLVFLVPAIVFVVLSWIKKSKKGKTIASTVMCGLSLIVCVIVGVASIAAADIVEDYVDDYDYDYGYGYDYDDYDFDYDFGLEDDFGYADDYSYSSVNLSDLYYLYCDSDYAVYSATENYLFIDTNPYDFDDYYDDDAWEAIQDVNDALGLPYSLDSEMSSTTSADGEQYKFYDDVTLMWTYSADSGLEVIYMEN